MDANAQLIIDKCEGAFPQAYNECNVFLRLVAHALNVDDNNIFAGNANHQAVALSHASDWERLGAGDAGALAAIDKTKAGWFVVAAWRNADGGHGHVAIAVAGATKLGWPFGYWGKHNGVGKKNASLRLSFLKSQFPDTIFYARKLP